MSDPFDRRLRACRERLGAVDADLLVLFPGPNLAYLTGFEETPSERHLLLFVPREGDPAFVVPELAAAEARETLIGDVRTWADGEDPTAVMKSVLADLGWRGSGEDVPEREPPRRVFVDDRMWALFTGDLRKLLPTAAFGLASEILGPLRIRKDETELTALRRASDLADRVAVEIRARGSAVVGTTERALAAEIDRLLREYGGIEPAFDTIVAAGENGARPHHRPSDREIRSGDPVVLDFGAFVPAEYESGTGTYPGDQTRTIVFDGDPPEGYERVHGTVERAQAAAVAAIEPGVPASDVDRAARDVIEAAGYGDAFVHRTGHGVGLEVHEPPALASDEVRSLQPEMVVSVEPGIYLEDAFGVRIEDLVLVTDDGAERLNGSPRTWRAGG